MSLADSDQPVRVATWNIHGGVGNDRRYDPARIIAVLRGVRCDIVALQEVASLALHGEFLRQLHDALGLHVVTGRTLTRRNAEFGNALLSRFPVVRNQSIELTVGHHEPRNAIDAWLDVDGREVRVVATHLGLRPAERREQVRRILDALAAGPRSVTVLMGDLNEWYLWGRPLRWLHARFASTAAPPTFPARRPVLALDRIWAYPSERLTRVATHRSVLARVASDHLPLLAQLSLDGAMRAVRR